MGDPILYLEYPLNFIKGMFKQIKNRGRGYFGFKKKIREYNEISFANVWEHRHLTVVYYVPKYGFTPIYFSECIGTPALDCCILCAKIKGITPKYFLRMYGNTGT